MSGNTPGDEFYVGYAPKAPANLARRTARTVAALCALAVAAALLLVFAQKPFPRAAFEYGQYREFSGVLEAEPYPALRVPRPGASYSRYLLVAPGKHGAGGLVTGFAGKQVRLQGSLIYRDGQTMIEILPGTLAVERAAGEPPDRPVELGAVTLMGEIVDSKCYLGVMNPGSTKVHRDCAARCISGGIPPLFVTRDAMYLLVAGDGRKLGREVLPLVAETIVVRGRVARLGETLILRAERMARPALPLPALAQSRAPERRR